jgi:hypothetical protein
MTSGAARWRSLEPRQELFGLIVAGRFGEQRIENGGAP